MAADKQTKISEDTETAGRNKPNDAVDSRNVESASQRFLQDSKGDTESFGKDRANNSADSSRRLEQDSKLGKLAISDAKDGKGQEKQSEGNSFLPENVLSKAHPKKGEGYYQPLSEAGKELLGRELDYGEVRALISASRALQKEKGKPVDSLSVKDVVLPQNKEELKTFVDNIGNPKYGVQPLKKDQVSKLKDEFAKKFEKSETPEEKEKEKEKSPEEKEKKPEEKGKKPSNPKDNNPQKPGDDPYEFHQGGEKKPAVPGKEQPGPAVPSESKNKPPINSSEQTDKPQAGPEQEKPSPMIPAGFKEKPPVSPPEQPAKPGSEQQSKPSWEKPNKPVPEQPRKPAPEQKEKPKPVPPPEQQNKPIPKPVTPQEQTKPTPEQKEKPKPIVPQTPPEKTPINQLEQKDKPKEQPRPREAMGPFTDVDPAVAAGLLNTPSGKDLPPLAERFEQESLRLLGPERQANVYVSNNDASSKNIPAGATTYKSIGEAIRKAPPGSVIQVMAGVYNEKISLGAEHSNLTLQTDRNNPAVINGGGFRVGSNAHDISICNFDVKNFSGQAAGIRIDGSNIQNITIAGNNVHDASNADGIAVYGRPGVPVSGINIIGNRVHDLKLAELEAMPINGNVDGFKVIGNSGFRLNNLFIDVIGGEGNGGNKDQARNGTIAFNFADGISSRHNPSYNDYSAGGIYVDGGKNLEIFGNYVRNSDFGIEVGSEHRGLNASGIQVHNNIFEKSNAVWLKLGYKGGVDNSSIKENLVLVNSPSNYEKEGPVAGSTKVEGNIGAKDRYSITRMPTIMISAREKR